MNRKGRNPVTRQSNENFSNRIRIKYLDKSNDNFSSRIRIKYLDKSNDNYSNEENENKNPISTSSVLVSN